MDTTIKPGTTEEKFSIMKAQLEKKGKWNEETESNLRETLGFFSSVVEVEEPVKEVKPSKKPSKSKKK